MKKLTKKLTKVSIEDLLEELSKRLPKEKVLEYLSKQDEVDKALRDTMDVLGTKPWEEPKAYYEYPNRNEFTADSFLRWVDEMARFYQTAEYWEVQERGSACSVDRAYRNWLEPQCNKMFKYLLGAEKAGKVCLSPPSDEELYCIIDSCANTLTQLQLNIIVKKLAKRLKEGK